MTIAPLISSSSNNFGIAISDYKTNYADIIFQTNTDTSVNQLDKKLLILHLNLIPQVDTFNIGVSMKSYHYNNTMGFGPFFYHSIIYNMSCNNKYIFWIQDPQILYKDNKFLEFIPISQMNRIEQLNAITRFLIYFLILAVAFEKPLLWILCLSETIRNEVNDEK